MTIGGLFVKPLTRPSATLSPSDGERDGVRGVQIIPPLLFGNWYELFIARSIICCPRVSGFFSVLQRTSFRANGLLSWPSSSGFAPFFLRSARSLATANSAPT